MGPKDTGRIVLESLTYADEPGEEPYYHDELIWCDDTPDAKVQMNVYRRDLGIRARPARKGRMRKLSYEWLANLREIVIDSERCPLTFSEFAWFEGLVNAVTHRNYAFSGDHIRVMMYDDRMEILSPGRLPNIVTLENMRPARGW